MGWSALIFAEVAFPAGGVARWKKLAADAELDWGEGTLVSSHTAPDATIAELLAEAIAHGEAQRAPDVLEVKLTARRLSLRAVIEESAHHYWGPLLCTLVCHAALAGGRGEYAVLTQEGDGERVVFGPDGQDVELFQAGDEIDSDLDYAAIFEEDAFSGRARAKRRRRH